MTVKERYNETIRDIESRAADPFLSPQEIAEDVARSNAMILRDMVAVFKYLTGSTLRAYISERKMMASYRYLIHKETRDIEHALEIAGYMDQPSYSKAFKARFGLSPGEAFKKKDLSLCVGPMTWDAISTGADATLPAEEEPVAVPETTRFGIPEAQYAKAAEAMELQAFYDFSPLISQFAFDLADRIGKSLSEAFRFVDSFRDEVEQHSESIEDPDAPEGTLITQEQLLHEYGDSEFYQRMFFERGIGLETISYFQLAHGATEEELLQCDPEMLAAFSETYEMSFHFFMRAWQKYMDYTGGKYDPERFEYYLEKLDEWTPVEEALDTAACALTDQDLEDAIYETDAADDPDADRYYAELDEILTRAYTDWDGGRIDEEPDVDNLGYEENDTPTDMDAYPFDDEERPIEDWVY